MEVILDQHMRFAGDHVVSEILHSCQDMRVILLSLQPGQEVAPHTSSSSVCLHVVHGSGELLVGCEWAPAGTGMLRFYPPGEAHGIRATTEPIVVLATLAPRP
ncbi:MAG TPA: cupin domain-containing protein [Symbiobacteriaceae bacterium]|nr:cupin domain-containing protein [Symbiobacteriaceae bacterium]